ncbi:MAG: PAS domain-containing protein [Planctomycetota bacterium]
MSEQRGPAPPGVVRFVRRQGELVELGHEVEAIWGYARDDLLAGAPPPLELVAAEDRPAVSRAWRQPGAQVLEFRSQHRDGSQRWVEERSTAEGEGLWIDRSEVERARLRRESDLLMHRLGDLAGGIVHEVNNPLAGVVNYARVVRRLAAHDERLREVADGILSESARVLETIDVLRSLTPAVAGEGPRPVAPEALLRGVLGLVRAPLRDAGIRYAIEPCAEELPAVVEHGHGLHVTLLLLVEALRTARPTSLRLRARRGRGGAVELVIAHDGEAVPRGGWLVQELLREHSADLELVTSGSAAERAVVLRVPAWRG